MNPNQLPNPQETQYFDISGLSNEMSKTSEILASIKQAVNIDTNLIKPPYKKIIFSLQWKGKSCCPFSVIYDENENTILSIVGKEDLIKLIIDKGGKYHIIMKESIALDCSPDPDGSIVKLLNDKERYTVITEKDENDSVKSKSDDNSKIIYCLYLFAPVLFALALLNCKRTTFEDEPGAKVKRMLNAHKREKKIIYKVLVINPLRARNKAEQDSIETGIKRTFHLCRGHFRTYIYPNLLFGKFEGTYYIEAHTRGDEKIGITHKSYQLETA